MPRIANDTSTSVHCRRVSCVSGWVWLFINFMLLLCFLSPVASRPLRPRYRYRNPCDLINPDHVPDFVIKNPTPQQMRELFRSLYEVMKATHRHAKEVLKEYVEESFKDKSFIEGTASHRLNWLPKVNISDVKDMDEKETLRYFYRALQYFGIGFELIITDELFDEGKHVFKIYDMEDRMAESLCNMQIAMISLSIPPDPDVTQDVMNQPYKKIAPSQRAVRVYLILRDYVHTVGVIKDSFGEISERTLLKTTDLAPTEPKRLVTH